MAHRGRLNVLANIIGKCPQEIFREFEDIEPELHIAAAATSSITWAISTDYVTAAGRHVHLSLCFNPSHLEFVNPVASAACGPSKTAKQTSSACAAWCC